MTYKDGTQKVEEPRDKGEGQDCSPLRAAGPVDVDCPNGTDSPKTTPVVAPVIVVPA